MRLIQSKRDGFAIATVLCVVVLLLIIGTGLLSVGMHQRMRGVRTSSEISARCSADAGLTKALAEMNKMLNLKTWNDTSLPSATDERLLNSDSIFSYNVAKIITADGNDLYTIQSTGNSSRSRKTVNATLELKGIFEYAIYVADTLDLKNGTSITAYNQKPGDHPLQIGTNSTASGAITAKIGVTIDGDVVVGVGGDAGTVIDSKAEAAISGQTYPSLIKNKTPAIKVPKYLLEMPSSGTITDSTTISTSATYDGINLLGTDPNGMSTITIDGKVEIYVLGDIILGNGDEIQILPGSTLTIYLAGNLTIDNGGAINNLTMDAKALKIYGLDTCTSIDFKNSADFYGAIYAPEADILLRNGAQVYGAMVGKTFTQDVSGNFHYDMSLREVDPSEIGVYMVIKRWSEQ